MATISTGFSPDAIPFPFIGVGVPAAQLITPIPSAEIFFAVNGGAVTLAGVGDDQFLEITCHLEKSFTYVLVESSFYLKGVDVDNWDTACRANILTAATAPSKSIGVEYNNIGLAHDTSLVSSRTYVAKNITKDVIIASGTSNPKFTVGVWNVVTNGAAATLNFFARFLRYDRIQSQFWQVNTPFLTR